MKKAILFDFGGTLDTNGIHWSEKFWDIYQRINVPITKRQYEEAYVFSESQMSFEINKSDNLYSTLYKQLQKQFEFLVGKKILSTTLQESYLNRIHSKCFIDVFNTVKRTKIILDKIKPNYKIGVVSNFYGNLKNVLEDLSLTSFFDVIIDSKDVGVSKPNPQIFQIALDNLKINPSDCFVVGDSYERDICPGKLLGCSTVWLDGKSWNRPIEINNADHIIQSIEGLIGILDEYKKESFSSK